MIPKLIHISIEQVLQVIDSNIYSNFKPKEIDLQFNTICDKFIDFIISNKIDGNNLKIFENIQASLDDLRLLVSLDNIISSDTLYFNLPSNYRNLLNDRSFVVRSNCFEYIKSGGIERGKYYINKSTITIVYNGQQYLSGQIFVGLKNISIFTYNTVPYTGGIIELLEKPNRLIEAENKANYKESNFTKPFWYSPISELSGNVLKLNESKDFTVEGVIIDYVRKLVPLDSSTPDVDWNTEFPEPTIKTLIDLTAKRLMFIVQSQAYQAGQIELAK